MKTRYLLLFLSFSMVSFSQTRDLKSFDFQNHTIDYTRIDYSKFGVAQFYITMYSSDTVYNSIEQTAYNCLLNKDRLYHTLYFFIRVPSSITDPKLKNKLFSEFVNHLKEEEKSDNINLYLNFDQNYSIQYRKEHMNANDIKRVVNNITLKSICRTLTNR